MRVLNHRYPKYRGCEENLKMRLYALLHAQNIHRMSDFMSSTQLSEYISTRGQLVQGETSVTRPTLGPPRDFNARDERSEAMISRNETPAVREFEASSGITIRNARDRARSRPTCEDARVSSATTLKQRHDAFLCSKPIVVWIQTETLRFRVCNAQTSCEIRRSD